MHVIERGFTSYDRASGEDRGRIGEKDQRKR